MTKRIALACAGLMLALSLLQPLTAARFEPVTDPQLVALRASCQGSGAVGYVLRVASTNAIGCAAQTTILSGRNRLVNGNLAVNQRGVATASTAYAAGAYTVDRWKAGASGATMSLTAAANGDTSASITAGSLLQVIEGALYLPEGGSYTASWSGTATCRAYQGNASGAYVASPMVVTGWAAGTNASLECQGGTLGLVQLEPGAVTTPFERRDDELRRCQRYFQRLLDPPLRGLWASATNAGRCGMSLPQTMRAAPVLSLNGTLMFWDGSVTGAATNMSATYTTATAIEADFTVSGSFTTNRPAILYRANQGGSLDASAEL